MLRRPHVSVRALLRDDPRVTRRPEREEHRHHVITGASGSTDGLPFWIDSTVMAHRIGDAHPDPVLRHDLDRLFPDTLADL